VLNKELLQDPSIKWLFERKANKMIEEIKEANTMEEKWENIRKILRQAAKESLGMKKKWCWKKGLRKWGENLDQIIMTKAKLSRTLEDQTEYKQCRAIAKKTVCKNKCETWNNFVSKLENFYGHEIVVCGLLLICSLSVCLEIAECRRVCVWLLTPFGWKTELVSVNCERSTCLEAS
jgi:hypothetical protein